MSYFEIVVYGFAIIGAIAVIYYAVVGFLVAH